MSGCWCSPAARARRCWRSRPGRWGGTGLNGGRSPRCTASWPARRAARRGRGAAPPATAHVDTVRQTLYGLGHDHGPSVEAYRVLLDEAERIRREIACSRRSIERLSGAGDPNRGRPRPGRPGQLPAMCSTRLPPRCRRPRRSTTSSSCRRAARRQRALARARSAGATDLTRRATAARLRALAGQLRAVVETTATGASEGRHAEPADVAGAPRLRDPVATVRANLTPDSAVLRHAVRAALLVAGSDLVVRLAGFGRGYWVSLTVLRRPAPRLRLDVPAVGACG